MSLAQPAFVVIAVAVAVVVVAVEALVFAGRGQWRSHVVNLLAGAFLMLALLAAVLAADWPWILATLSAAGLAHVLDLVRAGRAAQGGMRASK